MSHLPTSVLAIVTWLDATIWHQQSLSSLVLNGTCLKKLLLASTTPTFAFWMASCLSWPVLPVASSATISETRPLPSSGSLTYLWLLPYWLPSIFGFDLGLFRISQSSLALWATNLLPHLARPLADHDNCLITFRKFGCGQSWKLVVTGICDVDGAREWAM